MQRWRQGLIEMVQNHPRWAVSHWPNKKYRDIAANTFFAHHAKKIRDEQKAEKRKDSPIKLEAPTKRSKALEQDGVRV